MKANRVLAYDPSITVSYYEDAISGIESFIELCVIWPQDIDKFDLSSSEDIQHYNRLRDYINQEVADMRCVIQELYMLYDEYVNFPEDYLDEADYKTWAEQVADEDELIEYQQKYMQHMNDLKKYYDKLKVYINQYLQIYFSILENKAFSLR